MTSDTITVGITNDCRKQVLFFKSTNDIIKQKYLSAAMYPVHQVKCPVEAQTYVLSFYNLKSNSSTILILIKFLEL